MKVGFDIAEKGLGKKKIGVLSSLYIHLFIKLPCFLFIILKLIQLVTYT